MERLTVDESMHLHQLHQQRKSASGAATALGVPACSAMADALRVCLAAMESNSAQFHQLGEGLKTKYDVSVSVLHV